MINASIKLHCTHVHSFLASQLWLLMRKLPCIIAKNIPTDDANWQNYTLLSQITSYIFSPSINEQDCIYLKVHQFLMHAGTVMHMSLGMYKAASWAVQTFVPCCYYHSQNALHGPYAKDYETASLIFCEIFNLHYIGSAH